MCWWSCANGIDCKIKKDQEHRHALQLELLEQREDALGGGVPVEQSSSLADQQHAVRVVTHDLRQRHREHLVTDRLPLGGAHTEACLADG